MDFAVRCYDLPMKKNFQQDFNQLLIYETKKPDHKFVGDNNKQMLRISG
jgi:hypothetical protein